MDILVIIIVVLVAAFAIGILFRILKLVVKAFIFVSIVASILILMAGLLIFLDAKEFQKGFAERPSVYLLSEDGLVRAGLRVFPDGSLALLEEENLTAYNTTDLAMVQGTDFKMFLFDLVAFEDFVDLNVTVGNALLNRTEVVAVLTSENSTKIISEKLYQGLDPAMRSQVPFAEFDQGVRERLGSDAYVRSMVFARLLEKAQGHAFILFLANGFKHDQVKVYPKTVLFKAIHVLPADAIKNTLGGGG